MEGYLNSRKKDERVNQAPGILHSFVQSMPALDRKCIRSALTRTYEYTRIYHKKRESVYTSCHEQRMVLHIRALSVVQYFTGSHAVCFLVHHSLINPVVRLY